MENKEDFLMAKYALVKTQNPESLGLIPSSLRRYFSKTKDFERDQDILLGCFSPGSSASLMLHIKKGTIPACVGYCIMEPDSRFTVWINQISTSQLEGFVEALDCFMRKEGFTKALFSSTRKEGSWAKLVPGVKKCGQIYEYGGHHGVSE